MTGSAGERTDERAVTPAVEPTVQRAVFSVRQVNESISAALATVFPGTVWVRGEVQRLPADAAARTHIYFELHETGTSGAAEYQIPAALMGWDRDRYGLARYLDGTDPDLQIANRMEVCFECKVDFYAKFGKLSLKVVGIDKHFSLGKLEARRRETLAFLSAAGLLERQAALRLPDLPLRVGLVTALGSAAERDFLTGLQASRWPFVVTAAGAKMQGEQMQAEVIRAVGRLAAAQVQVIVITRGGGSRADLSWFDQRDLAVTIAQCPVPVITAIGHEIDRGIADLVAHRAVKTPTAAAEFLVGVVDRAADRLAQAAGALAERAGLRLVLAAESLANLRARVLGGAGGSVARRRQRLAHLPPRLTATVKGPLQAGRLRQTALAGRLVRESLRALAGTSQWLGEAAAGVRRLDPVRLLARGYTITRNLAGRAVTDAAGLRPGDRILTLFRDGEILSLVQAARAAGGAGPAAPAQPKGKSVDGKEKDSGQETLFR